MKALQISALFFAWAFSLMAAEPVGPTDSAPPSGLRCAPAFGDHAIFQRNIPVPVWGWARPGATVTVIFHEQTKTTEAGKDGRWEVALDAMAADKLDSPDKAPAGRTLTVTSELGGEKKSKSFADILIGEVWLCSGQSNMAAKVRHNHSNQDPNDNLLESNLPAIRQVSLPDGWKTARSRPAAQASSAPK